MDDLERFRDFRAGVAAPSGETRRSASARLVTVIAKEQMPRRRLRLLGRRRVRLLAIAAGLAVVGGASAFAVRELMSVDPYARGTETRTVEGMRFSFSVPRWKGFRTRRGAVGQGPWENGPPVQLRRRPDRFENLGLYISKSMVGGQSAEAIFFWSGFSDDGRVTPCASMRSAANGSTAEIAAAAARTPGVVVLRGPRATTVGGRPAHEVVLRIRRDRVCDPGFFFTWKPRWPFNPRSPDGQCWGACWLRARAGETIRLWIVDVGGKRLAFEAVTADPSDALAREVEAIIASVRFH